VDALKRGNERLKQPVVELSLQACVDELMGCRLTTPIEKS
jgi:hypothetical protein